MGVICALPRGIHPSRQASIYVFNLKCNSDRCTTLSLLQKLTCHPLLSMWETFSKVLKPNTGLWHIPTPPAAAVTGFDLSQTPLAHRTQKQAHGAACHSDVSQYFILLCHLFRNKSLHYGMIERENNSLYINNS